MFGNFTIFSHRVFAALVLFFMAGCNEKVCIHNWSSPSRYARPRPRLSLADLCRVARPFCCCWAGDRKMNYTNPFIYLYTYLSNTPNFIGFEIWFISGWLTAKKVIEWERTNKSGEWRALPPPPPPVQCTQYAMVRAETKLKCAVIARLLA